MLEAPSGNGKEPHHSPFYCEHTQTPVSSASVSITEAVQAHQECNAHHLSCELSEVLKACGQGYTRHFPCSGPELMAALASSLSEQSSSRPAPERAAYPSPSTMKSSSTMRSTSDTAGAFIRLSVFSSRPDMPGLPTQQAALGGRSSSVSEACCPSVKSLPVNCGRTSAAQTAVAIPACALVCKSLLHCA